MIEINKMLTKAQLDKYNRNELYNGDKNDLICCVCRRFVNESESYSKRGNNLICINCFDNVKYYLGISEIQMLTIIQDKYKLIPIDNIDVFKHVLKKLKEKANFKLDDDVYKKYYELYKEIIEIDKDFDYMIKNYDGGILYKRKYRNCEQNMNKKDIDIGYQE